MGGRPSRPYLEAEQDAEVPGGHVLDPVEHVHLRPGGPRARPGVLVCGGTQLSPRDCPYKWAKLSHGTPCALRDGVPGAGVHLLLC